MNRPDFSVAPPRNPPAMPVRGLFTIGRLAAAVAVFCLPPLVSAAPITWSAPATIAGDTDVSTAGTAKCAYRWGSATSHTVNGVTFTGSTSTSGDGGNISMSGFTHGSGEYYASASAPFANLSAAYKGLLIGGTYAWPTAVATVTLRGLTVGKQYAVQIWMADARGFIARNAAVSGGGGNTITLTYNTAAAEGGLGQSSIGTFTANATTQAFTITGGGTQPSSQLNAIQLRDTTPPLVSANGIWTNVGGGNWFGAGNWAAGTVANGTDMTADFSTLALPADTTVTLDGAVSIGHLLFGDQNANDHAWMLDGSGPISLAVTSGPPVIIANVPVTMGTTITGAAGLKKAGGGTLTLSGTNTYQGPTLVSGGTLRLAASGQRVLPSDLKIMPLGDSITKGDNGTNAGYRGYLRPLLAPIAANFQFVGVSTLNPGSLPVSPLDQTHHNGYASYSSVDLSNNLDGLDLRVNNITGSSPQGGYWMVGGHGTGRDAVFPDIVLLKAGINDIYWNTAQINVANYPSNLTALINKILTLAPAARVIVAEVTPWTGHEAEVAAINSGVRSVVTQFQALGKAVNSVDMNTGFPANGSDGLHPNDTGYAWMAGQWHDAILAAVSVPASVSTALPAATLVTIATGAALDLDDTQAAIAGLDVSGRLLLGAGALAIGGNASFASGASFAVEINRDDAGAGLVAVSGNLALGGATLDLAASGNSPLNPGAKFTIATYSGTLSGTFAGLPERAAIHAGESSFVVRYADGGKAITLTVATPYQAWAATHFPGEANAAITGPDADPDSDGVANGIEFLTGSLPNDGASKNAPSIVTDDNGDLVVTFQRVDAAEAYEVAVEYSTTLENPWSPIPIPNTATAGPPVTVADNGDAPDSITVVIPATGDPRKFARVRIVIPTHS